MESGDENFKIVNGFKVKKRKTELEKRLTNEEVEILLASINSETHKNYWRRNKAIIEFMLHTAMRVGEISQLKIFDVIAASGKIKSVLDVRSETAKRKKARHVPLNETAQVAIRVLMEGRDPVFTDPLIVKPNGGRLTKRGIQNVVTMACLKSGINRLCSPHMMRHTCLSMVYELTHDLKITQTLAGHSNPALTMRLYTHCTLDGMTQAVKLLDKNKRED